jgi:phage repressor protein C with HTH and peptisase S24 domain
MRFARTLKECRQRAEMLQAELAAHVGVTAPYISLLETGKRPPPTDEVTLKIERALGLPAKSLLRLAHIDRTPEDIREATNLDDLYERGDLARLADHPERLPESHDLKRVPLINRASAGYPADFTHPDYAPGVTDDYVVMPDLADPNAFAITVVGDSMSPRFLEGDIIIISPASGVEGGDFCFVRIDHAGEVTSTFKQVFFENDRIRLVSLNPAYPPRTCHRSEISGLYRAIRRLETL